MQVKKLRKANDWERYSLKEKNQRWSLSYNQETSGEIKNWRCYCLRKVVIAIEYSEVNQIRRGKLEEEIIDDERRRREIKD